MNLSPPVTDQRGHRGITPKISLIMPCFGRRHGLRAVLDAYNRQAGDIPFELIAVDDGSTDGTYELLCSYPAQRFVLRPIRQERNCGPAAARNRGLELARGELIAFVGDDILPEHDFIERMAEAHHRHPEPETAILGHIRWADKLPCNTLMEHIDGRGAQQFSYFYLRDGQVYDYRHFYTANISIKREILHRVSHWFDTSFPYAAFEDAELAYRLSQRGLRIRYCATVRVQHDHYHTIWTFARRQRLSGRSAHRLIQLHPATIRDVLPLGHRWLMSFLLRPRFRSHDPELPRVLEYLACVLASFYEWSPHPLVDGLYHHLLHYFYYAGFAERVSRSGRLRSYILGNLAWSRLLPAMIQFVRAAERSGISLPEGYRDELRRTLQTRHALEQTAVVNRRGAPGVKLSRYPTPPSSHHPIEQPPTPAIE